LRVTLGDKDLCTGLGNFPPSQLSGLPKGEISKGKRRVKREPTEVVAICTAH